MWVPPWRLYTTLQIVEALRGQCIGIFGDSLNRRLTSTLADLPIASVNGSANDIRGLDKDLGNGAHEWFDWSDQVAASGVKCLRYHWLPISQDIRAYLEGNEAVRRVGPGHANYTLLIFSVGVHNAEKGIDFGAGELAKKMCEVSRKDEDRLVLWRSAPFMWDEKDIKRTRLVNERISASNKDMTKQLLHHCALHIPIIDNKAILKPVSTGPNRMSAEIHGDSFEHFALLPRIV